MRNKGVGQENVLWINEGKGRAKIMNSNRRHMHMRALRALLSVFIFAFLFAAIPVSAHQAESTHQFTLEIYGNANEDDTIDMRDVTYIKLVIFGKKPETEFSDANYDGRVSMLDVVQTKLIIVGKEAKLTIVDSADRIVTVSMPVERIVPMVTWSYEPIWILRAQDKVVGITTTAQEDYSWLPGIQDKPTVGTYKELDYESVIALEPDIVIVLDRKVEEVERNLESFGITTVALNLRSQKKFDSEFKILAYILGEDEKANRFISWKNGYLDWIKEETEGIEPKVRVYAEWSDWTWGTGSEGSGVHDVITMSGGYNIASDLPGPYPQVDPEWVIRENPEVIFFPAFDNLTGYTMDSDENAKLFIEEACNRTGLKETDAVENGRVYVIDGFCVEAVRGFVGVCYCAKWFYPELFEDLNPDAIHREYFEKWLGVPYRGIWAYPLIGG